jgi:two-component system cell cycle sensor histidine kinase PleC
MLTGFVRNHTGIVLALPFIVASWLLPLLPFWAIATMVTMVIGLEIFFILVALRLQGAARNMLIFKAQKEQLIIELRREKECAEQARVNAEEASRAKSHFLAAMSHELRTPLNAIMGFSDILRREMLGPHGIEAYKDYADDIHSSGHYLLTLINDILDLSRIEAGRRELCEEPLALATSLRNAVRMIEAPLNEKSITLAIEIDGNFPKLMGDRRALHQIWLNLLSNALKFTPVDGRIEIAVEQTPRNGVAVHILDNGPGIPAHEVETAMIAYSRGSFATRQAIEGAGLGLPITRGLMALHGGSIEIRARAGGGTDAVVVFPEERVLSGTRGELLSEPTATQKPAQAYRHYPLDTRLFPVGDAGALEGCHA